MNPITETFTSAPHAGKFMFSACLPSAGWQTDKGFPDLTVTWKDFILSSADMCSIGQICHNGHPLEGNRLSLLAPSILGFRLVMVMVTHRAWPLPIWTALQTRNRFILHRPIEDGERFDLSIGVDGWRVLEKGLEVDLHSRLMQGAQCAWEGIVTFYYRGRFGKPLTHGKALGAPAESPALQDTLPIQTWLTNDNQRWQLGALTGDYNGIHQWDAYAKLLGFRKAFAHSQGIAAQCLPHLSVSDALPIQLDLWIKGPVFYGSKVKLLSESVMGSHTVNFGLKIANDSRFALIGTCS